jgi:hypothetical protein
MTDQIHTTSSPASGITTGSSLSVGDQLSALLSSSSQFSVASYLNLAVAAGGKHNTTPTTPTPSYYSTWIAIYLGEIPSIPWLHVFHIRIILLIDTMA